CRDCMVHCGYEPAAVETTFGSLAGLLMTARLVLFGPPRSRDAGLGRRDEQPAVPAPSLRTQSNGLPALPILDRVA
ncbi:MAG: hopanoid biosynthesis associated radical SAM protein HpnH, partial [Planctomycetia bacterium]